MTSRLLTPWWRDRTPLEASACEQGSCGSVKATRLLDWHSARVGRVSSAVAPTGTPLEVLRGAHGWISEEVEARYSVNDRVPASRVLARGHGSCSQRFSVLEAVGRSCAVPTRSRALLVDGAFWNARFTSLRPLVPDVVVLAWPEFRIEGDWLGVGELFGPCSCSGEQCAFSNVGGETFFDAVGRRSLDWNSAGLGTWLVADLGLFASRDEVFARYGQTLAEPVARIGDVLLRRRTAR